MTELRKRPRQKRSEAMVEAILEAAARIIEEEGLDRLNTNATAAKAGCSVGSLYQYFPSKDAILAELIRRDHLALLEQLTLAARESAGATLEQAVYGLVGVGVERQLARPVLARALDFAEARLVMDQEAEATLRAIEAVAIGLLGVHLPHLSRKALQLAAADVSALAKGMIDAAGRRGEASVAALTARVTHAALGYLTPLRVTYAGGTRKPGAIVAPRGSGRGSGR
jgi:AcrR family transcriptional regulator